ncbi:MAG: hypothetical protein QF664_05525, partial [Dehalococcoidia bacterium]|nr:hypothetical protein [Dehalococcoidia bacterium]
YGSAETHRLRHWRTLKGPDCMPAPWSDFEPVVQHTFSITPEASRSDFIDICYANEISDDVIDGFDSLDGRLIFKSADEAREALAAAGALSD